ncbi:MAG: McrB family protein [Thermoleophilia bacterium]
MGFDQLIVDRLVTLVRQRFPDWHGFDNEAFRREERNYKVEVVEKAVGTDGLLRASVLREDLDGHAFTSFIDRFEKIGQAANLLFLDVPKTGDLSLLRQAREGGGEILAGLCDALYDLLWGTDSSPERLGRYVAFVTAHDLPNKWTLPTYFLFLAHPSDDLFVKPHVMGALAKELGATWSVKGEPTAEEYAKLLVWARELRTALGSLGAVDMIDVQSLLWVAGSQLTHALEPASSAQRELGAPFDQLFANRTEAEAAFDLFADALRALGVASNDDSRFAITYSAGSRHLTLDYGAWCVVRACSVSQARRLQLAVPENSDAVAHLPVDYRFKETAAGDAFVLRTLGPTELTPEIRSLFLNTAAKIGQLFSQHNSSNSRKYHVDELAIALLDPSSRDSLLTKGLLQEMTSPREHETTKPAFSATAREILIALAAEPTKAFYAAHKEELAEHVQEPLKTLLLAVGERAEPALRDTLETRTRLFSKIPKNDYGKGGAWPYYWGAFYPKGSKKTQGCQLYVSLGDGGLTYGFSIGEYASEDRNRFTRNVEVHRLTLVTTLADTIAASDFGLGTSNESQGDSEIQGGDVGKSFAGHDLASWLAEVSTVGPHVRAVVPWHELLTIGREHLIEVVATAFDRLFPLILLCTLDEPMPAIHDYLDASIISQDEDDDLNPPYSLDDLAAETSLPKENLASWLRAIERKGQAILYGPPGTDKTYVAERLAKHLVAGGTGIAELVQFHPAYAYEDFMQGMRPKARDGGGLDYPIVDGRFKQFCQQARGRQGLSVLVIDEVNRANLARVFGELMYLLEYRDKSIPLAAGGSFSIPGNVRIIGTMNTADRSIALVDHALRRRFAFLPLYPDYHMLADYHVHAGQSYDPARLIDLLKELNHKIGDHHYEVGTSFFMRPDIGVQLADVWRMEIEPYLEEYFFDHQGTVDSYRWDEVKKKLGME